MPVLPEPAEEELARLRLLLEGEAARRRRRRRHAPERHELTEQERWSAEQLAGRVAALEARLASAQAASEALGNRIAELDALTSAPPVPAWLLRLQTRLPAWAAARLVPATVAPAGAVAIPPAGPVDVAVPAAPRVLPPLLLPVSSDPTASIVICAHDKLELTYHCLWAIRADVAETPYEVIVVDDASTDETAAVIGAMPGVRLLRNEENLGFLRSANRGIAAARGEFVVLLNNDTGVQPGWLDALVDRAASDPQIGVVGARLLGGDGLVQEAGGIIWSDASGWNYGRGLSAADPRVLHARDVDYCSGAALLVRRGLLARTGGFDERYTPAYYEDADLAFQARAAGYRVVYEPQSVVHHLEGASYGTDLTQGGKRHQVRNREVFAERWAVELESQPAMDPSTVALAARHGRPPLVLFVDNRVPVVERDAGSVRLRALMRIFQEEGYAVALQHDDGIPVEPATADLRADGVEVLEVGRPLRAYLEEMAQDLRMVFVVGPEAGMRNLTQLRSFAPDAALVFDTVDLHFLRESRQADVTGSLRLKKVSAATREIELALTRAADVTLVVSPTERELLAGLVPEATVQVVGLIHEAAPVPPRAGRTGVLFVGGYEHEPNVDAAEVLAREIVPELRRLVPDATATIVGSHVTPAVEALGEIAGVTVAGWVEDLEPVLGGHRVFVAPLRYGAGVKGKIGQALAHGLPVVTTGIGIEGTGLVDGEHVLLGEDAEQLAAAAARLLTDDELWDRLSVQGRRWVAAQESPAVAREQVRELLAGLGLPTADAPRRRPARR